MIQSLTTLASHENKRRTVGARCLFVCTTAYNASVLRHVAQALPDWDSWFTPIYSTLGISFRLAQGLGLLKWTTLNPELKGRSVEQMEKMGLRLDIGATHRYDIIVLGNDFFIPQDLRSRQPKVLIQEGWVWFREWRRWIAEHTPLPPWFAGANGAGLSRNYEYFCVASQGYKELFVRSGIEDHRVVVTGLPTLDAVERDFKHLVDDTRESNFVLITTHPGREYFDGENRRKLLAKGRTIAQGRPIIVKLHPHEDHVRATREVSAWLPEAAVIVDADVNKLIANCSALVTTYSTTVFYALLLGKEVHCSHPINEILRLLPEQNGQAAQRIADVCRTALIQVAGVHGGP